MMEQEPDLVDMAQIEELMRIEQQRQLTRKPIFSSKEICSDSIIQGYSASFQPLGADDKSADDWDKHYPVAVYGSLRRGFVNHWRMGSNAPQPEYAKPVLHDYFCWRKAFLPHFEASGLALATARESSAPFEVYFYSSNEFPSVIKTLDDLETFSPSRYFHDRTDRAYIRALAWVHILPNDFESYWHDSGSVWEDNRNLQLFRTDWDRFVRIPCWIYLSKEEALISKRLFEGESPIIWFGEDV